MSERRSRTQQTFGAPGELDEKINATILDVLVYLQPGETKQRRCERRRVYNT